MSSSKGDKRTRIAVEIWSNQFLAEFQTTPTHGSQQLVAQVPFHSNLVKATCKQSNHVRRNQATDGRTTTIPVPPSLHPGVHHCLVTEPEPHVLYRQAISVHPHRCKASRVKLGQIFESEVAHWERGISTIILWATGRTRRASACTAVRSCNWHWNGRIRQYRKRKRKSTWANAKKNWLTTFLDQ